MGGIGKTTIAKCVYNQNYRSFDGSSFLGNIREVSNQPNGLVQLQRQLLSDICRKKQGKIHNVAEGISRIRKLISCKRVLVILDDVEEAEHIYDILGMQDWLFPGSKVIITSRQERLLKPHQIIRVKKLGEKESFKLFCFHAFGKDFPWDGYIENTNKAVKISGGLPLALKVIGSSLSRKNEDEWIVELRKLEAIPHSQIVRKLKISFDYLFLDIACFFVGTDTDVALKFLEIYNFHAKLGIQNLIDRCLLEQDSHVVLKMHRLIQDMGQEIIKQESDEAGERSRIWHYGEAFRVLRNETGTKTIEGLTVDMHMLNEAEIKGRKCLYDELRGKSNLLNYADSLRQRFLSLDPGKLASRNDVYLRTNAFKSMRKLRLLKLNYVKLIGSYENFPKRLAWLCWNGFSGKTLPVEFTLDDLVILELRHSSVQQVWKATPFLESLKILDLSYSKWLERTPNFKGLPKLERLILKGCVRLVKLCESIGNLEVLDLIDLQDCITLKKLPRNIDKLASLKTLIISGCNVCEFPSDMKNMRSFEVLNANGVRISSSNSNIDEIRWWQPIVWSMVSTPRKGPNTLWASFPRSLKQLRLLGCNLSDDSFPLNFDNLPSLSYLDLSRSQFRRLPNCVRSHKGITELHIKECDKLESLELNNCLPNMQRTIDATNCRSLANVEPLNGHARLWLGGCGKLVELEDSSEQGQESAYAIESYMMATFEYGIFSIYVPSGPIPRFSGEKHQGSSINFIVPLHSTRRIRWLQLCCISEEIQVRKHVPHWFCVTIENKTKNLTWIHSPYEYFYYKNLQWFSRWRLGNQLEAGDQVNITFDFKHDIKTKECFYKIVYEMDKEEEYGSRESDHDFPALKLSTGEYFLGNCFAKDSWLPKVDIEHRDSPVNTASGEPSLLL